MERRTTTTTTSHSLTSSSTTTGDRTDRIRQQDWKILLRDYEQKVNRPTPYIAQQLLKWYDKMDVNAVLYAINETAGAPRPSWAYCNAILTRVSHDYLAGRNYRNFDDSYHITLSVIKNRTWEIEQQIENEKEAWK